MPQNIRSIKNKNGRKFSHYCRKWITLNEADHFRVTYNMKGWGGGGDFFLSLLLSYTLTISGCYSLCTPSIRSTIENFFNENLLSTEAYVSVYYFNINAAPSICYRLVEALFRSESQIDTSELLYILDI